MDGWADAGTTATFYRFVKKIVFFIFLGTMLLFFCSVAFFGGFFGANDFWIIFDGCGFFASGPV